MSARLVIIDGQRIFTDPSSPWASPMWEEAQRNIRALAQRFEAVRTRWIPPADPRGSWGPYMEAWPHAQLEADDPLLDFDTAIASISGPVVEAPTFGKWGELAALCGQRIILTGVSTDCCVLSTALAAADAGAYVTVAGDACAGSDLDNHRAALHCMSLYPPQIQIATTAKLLAGESPRIC